jgi:PAS domain S-box-containing protein
MNVPATPIEIAAAREHGHAVGFWREDFTVRSFSLEPGWRQCHGLNLPDGADSALQWLQLVHPDDRAVLADAQKSLQQSAHRAVDIEYRIMAPDRGWFWVAQRGQVVDQAADGRPRVAAGVIVDIDGAKKARLALGATAAQRDVAVWAGELGLYDWDLEFDRWRWINDWCRPQQVDAIAGAEVLARWLTLVHPDDRAGYMAAVEDFRLGRRAEFDVEYRLRNRSGDWVWLQDRARAQQHDVGGCPRTALGVRRSIDALRRVTEEHEHLTNHLQVATSHCTDWLMLFDTAGRCQFANRAFRGMVPAQMVGRDVREFVAPAKRERVQVLFARAIEQASSLETEQRYTNADGSERVFHIRLSPVIQQGAVTSVVISANEITAQRQLERELLEVVAAEQHRIGSELHDGVGQELTGVAMLLQSALRELRSSQPGLVNSLNEVVAQLSRTIESTRALARGLSPLGLDERGLPGALQDLAARLDRHCGLRVRFRNRLRDAPVLAAAQQAHLLRIAQEALNNALKHSAATEVVIELGDTAEGTCISVRDNGRGFPDEQPLDRRMGLRLMHYRARLLGAELRVYSAPNQGVTITCCCPIKFLKDCAATRTFTGVTQ